MNQPMKVRRYPIQSTVTKVHHNESTLPHWTHPPKVHIPKVKAL
ncbi:hypothetical protein [Bacillus toyonensis]|nr:hypothetical protein [Bacillus toyonensis]